MLPPTIGSFSMTATFAPASAASMAADNPAAPLPTTTTSNVLAFVQTGEGRGDHDDRCAQCEKFRMPSCVANLLLFDGLGQSVFDRSHDGP